jgi:hypothetical protein
MPFWSFQWRFFQTGYKQVKIKIKRLECTDHGIFGHLTTDNGFECVTLERHDISIPEGVYQASFFESPHFKRLVLLLHNVPGRADIEVHCGNVEGDSKGCILVGMRRDGYTVLESKKALSALLEALKGADELSVEIH